MRSRLRRTDCSTPGLARRRRGRGFEYVDAQGVHVDDPAVLARIRALTIPPAWTDVWISPIENGHLQAVGTDDAGRRQYLYHERWRIRRDQEKFARMLLFAKQLPRLRRSVTRDLRLADLSEDRVLACAIRLLDVGLFRVGNQVYADENGSYGLTTLERRHVSLDGDGVVLFDYTAKGGLRRRQSVRDREVRGVVAALKRRRGNAQFLAYQEHPRGRWSLVRSEEINERIKVLTGLDEASAKDFRTWHATVLAATSVAAGSAESPRGRERVIREAVAEVADLLGNTPTVARNSYIDPQVFDRYRAGATIGADVAHSRSRTRVERAVIALLDR
jgi:DNA topoisomerase IB